MRTTRGGAGSLPGNEKCAKCGACTAVCPVYRASGNEIYSARGKRHLAEVFKGKRPGPVFEDIYSKCLLCGACSTVCPRKLDITKEVVSARADFSALYGEYGYQKFLARKALNRPKLLDAARVLGCIGADIFFKRLPADSGLRLRLAQFVDQIEPRHPGAIEFPVAQRPASVAEITYFPGCAAAYLYPGISTRVREIVAEYGYTAHTPEGLACCGLAAHALGHPEEARRLAERNITRLEGAEGPILVSCGSCFSQLAGYEVLFENDPDWRRRAARISERVIEISVFLQDLLKDTRRSIRKQRQGLKVFYHDPCHLRHAAGITEEPRTLLKRMPGIEVLELADGPQCCGQGGLFHLGAPELSAAIRDDLAAKIVRLQPDVITTTCSGCLMQLRSAMAAMNSTIAVIHLAALLK